MERVDETRLLVSLTDEDMKAFDLEYDQFLWTDKRSKVLVKNLLDIAKQETGFFVGKNRLMIEVFPKLKGCMVIFTLLDKVEIKRKVYKIKKKGDPTVYKFNNTEDVLLAIEKLMSINNRILKNSLVQYDNKYFMIIYTNCGLTPLSNDILNEYGNFYGYGKIIAAHILEYGNIIESKDAIKKIGSYL